MEYLFRHPPRALAGPHQAVDATTAIEKAAGARYPNKLLARVSRPTPYHHGRPRGLRLATWPLSSRPAFPALIGSSAWSQMAAQVDVDQACLELNDRSRHPINRFMSCPLGRYPKIPTGSRPKDRLIFTTLGWVCRRRVRGFPAKAAHIDARSDRPAVQKRPPAPNHRYRCRYLSKVYAPCGTRGCVKWKTLGLRIYLPILPIMSPIIPPILSPPPVPVMSPLASLS